MKGHIPHSLENITKIKGDKVIHYTCNAPSQKILDKNGVECVGSDYGCADNREVVIFTRMSLENILSNSIHEDISLLKIDCETALRKMK